MKFSIGIPAYKASFLKECIDSILCQTYAQFELIIVNDASPENLEEIVASYNDNRIYYFRNEYNIGAENVVDNWNTCLAHASGDFFVLMGDDDKMAPNYLEEFSKLIDEYPSMDVFHCRSKIINEDSQEINITNSWPKYETVYENMFHRFNFSRTQFISDFVYRTVTLKENGGFYKLPLAWASDDISSFIAMGNKGIAHTQQPVFFYRSNPQTITNTGMAYLKLEAILKERLWIASFLEKKPSNDSDELFRTLINLNLNKYSQKKKILVISSDLNHQFIIKLFGWLHKRTKYAFSASELFYAVLLNLKQRISK